MACSKHTQRRNKNCPDCYPVVVNDVEAAPSLSNESLELVGDIKASLDGSSEVKEGYPRVEEGKYVRVLIEAEIQKALAKVRQEMNELRNIQWEHIHIPYSTFCLDLMYALEKDSWKFVDFIKNPKQYGYSDVEDCAVFHRIKRKDGPPVPDFSKQGSVKRYIDKKNGKEAQA